MNLFRILNNWLTKRAAKLEKSRFGILAMYNAMQSCVGSIAVMKILQNDAGLFLLGTTTALTMVSNSVFIAQGSSKLCLLAFYLSIVVNNIIIFSLGIIGGFGV
jgi:hypothetical protein